MASEPWAFLYTRNGRETNHGQRWTHGTRTTPSHAPVCARAVTMCPGWEYRGSRTTEIQSAPCWLTDELARRTRGSGQATRSHRPGHGAATNGAGQWFITAQIDLATNELYTVPEHLCWPAEALASWSEVASLFPSGVFGTTHWLRAAQTRHSAVSRSRRTMDRQRADDEEVDQPELDQMVSNCP